MRSSAYPLDLNPIEEAFSKIMGLLRGAKARTREALIEALGTALDAVTAKTLGAPPGTAVTDEWANPCNNRCSPPKKPLTTFDPHLPTIRSKRMCHLAHARISPGLYS